MSTYKAEVGLDFLAEILLDYFNLDKDNHWVYIGDNKVIIERKSDEIMGL